MTLTKEWLLKTIAELEEERDAIPGAVNEDAAMALAAMKLALASLEAEPVAYMTYKGYLLHAADPKLAEYSEPTPLYDAPPAPVSVPDESAIFDAAIDICRKSDAIDEHAWNHGVLAVISAFSDCCAAMLQGAESVTRQSDGVSSEQHEPPERGWVVTHGGKDYFYREQPDAVTHLNAALESGRGVSLKYLSAEPISEDYKLNSMNQKFHYDRTFAFSNSPAIPDGWVACSERIPDADGNYWGWWSESKRQGPVWFIKSELQAQFQSSEITHWMPLPAAPQHK